MVDLHIDFAGLVLPNPVMTASGTFGYGREFAQFVDPARLGAVVTKGVSLNPRAGNPPPRIVETPAGMLNAIGLENVGLEAFIKEKLQWLAVRGAIVVANILGDTVDEYAAITERLSQTHLVDMIEVNVSCPNVKAGGFSFGTNPEATAEVTKAVVAATDMPVMVKLTPLVTDIVEIAQAAVDAGARAVSLINTIPAMAVDVNTRKPKLANVIGGLSGPAVKPVALRLVREVAKAVNVPVVGIGGIMTAEDAIEFLLVGASAVQVGTANFINPRATMDIVEGIELYMQKNDMPDMHHLIGKLDV